MIWTICFTLNFLKKPSGFISTGSQTRFPGFSDKFRNRGVLSVPVRLRMETINTIILSMPEGAYGTESTFISVYAPAGHGEGLPKDEKPEQYSWPHS